MSGIEIVEKGTIWRIGDGMGLNIWSAPWIPRDLSRKPITPKGHNLLFEVAELIDPCSGRWDETLVRDLFWEEDALSILALPVHQGRDNILAWHYDKHGLFSVKSAYKVARVDSLKKGTNGGQQGGSNVKPIGLWKEIWKLICPNDKIKHFLWRFAHNRHPLRSILFGEV